MNIRNVLRTYSLLRQLSDDESALLETLRAMNETERELLVQSLQPEKMVTKKAGKKSSSKSQRASSLAAQIKGAGKPHLGDGPVCTICSHTEDYEDHFKPSPHYHPFQPPAPAAATPSSTNGESAIESESAATAGGAP